MSIDLSKQKRARAGAKTATGKKTPGIMDFLNKDIALFSSGLKDKKKERFYSDLHILISSGIDIKTALELIVEDQPKKKDKDLFTAIKNKVLNGSSLSDAIDASGKFSAYEYFSIKIGEESGRLVDVLTELTTFFNKKIKQKRQLVGAFSYPVLVLVTALAAMFFMMNFIVPMFQDVFKRFHGKLPYITDLIIRFSDVFTHYIGYFFLLAFSLGIFMYIQRKSVWYRNFSSRVLLRLPVFGSIVKKIYMVRFCHSMALLIGSRTPMLQALRLVRNMIGFYPIEVALESIDREVMRGKSLNESMKKFKIFDKRIVTLVRVAEEVNELDAIFTRLNKQYSEELDHRISLISSLLEPIMILFVGALVAVILIAMYLPLFQLSTSIY